MLSQPVAARAVRANDAVNAAAVTEAGVTPGAECFAVRAMARTPAVAVGAAAVGAVGFDAKAGAAFTADPDMLTTAAVTVF